MFDRVQVRQQAWRLKTSNVRLVFVFFHDASTVRSCDVISSTMFWPSSQSKGDLTPVSRISSWCVLAFKVPVTTFNCIRWSSDNAPRTIMLQKQLLALKINVDRFLFSSPEPKAPRWAIRIPVTLSSVRRHFQTSSSLKPLGQLNSNSIWRLFRMGEQKFVQMVLVTWPRWPRCPYMVKTL